MTTSATSSDARIAITYAVASGRKNVPASPPRKNTGMNTNDTIRLAYTTALRTSSEASNTTRNAERGLPSSRLIRNRRTMFSTSMIASSTTSPRAITRPASTIVSIIPPV